MQTLKTLRHSLPVFGAALVGFGVGLVAFAARLNPACRIAESTACQSVLWAEQATLLAVVAGGCCIAAALGLESLQEN